MRETAPVRSIKHNDATVRAWGFNVRTVGIQCVQLIAKRFVAEWTEEHPKADSEVQRQLKNTSISRDAISRTVNIDPASIRRLTRNSRAYQTEVEPILSKGKFRRIFFLVFENSFRDGGEYSLRRKKTCWLAGREWLTPFYTPGSHPLMAMPPPRFAHRPPPPPRTLALVLADAGVVLDLLLVLHQEEIQQSQRLHRLPCDHGGRGWGGFAMDWELGLDRPESTSILRRPNPRDQYAGI